MIEEITLVRHAQRPMNLKEAPPSFLEKGGPSGNPSLTAEGRLQAEQLAVYLSTFPADQRIQLVVTSPYLRCVETIYPTVESLKTPLLVDPVLQECLNGDGWHPSLALTQDLVKKFPRIDERHKSTFQFCTEDQHALPGFTKLLIPENHEVACRRACLTLPILVKQIEEEHKHVKRIVLVTHGTPAIWATRALLGDDHVFSDRHKDKKEIERPKENMHDRVGMGSVTRLRRVDRTKVLGGFEAVCLGHVGFRADGAKNENAWHMKALHELDKTTHSDLDKVTKS